MRIFCYICVFYIIVIMIEPFPSTAFRYKTPHAELVPVCTSSLLCDSAVHYEADSELVIVDGPEL